MMDFGYPYGYGGYRRRPTEDERLRAYQIRQQQLAEAEEQRRLAYQQRLQEQQAYEQQRQEQLAYQQQRREQLAQAKREAEKQRRQELFEKYTAAATRIQAAWRGHRARRELGPVRAELAYLAAASAEVARDVAAFEAAVAGLDWAVENTRAVEQTVLGFEHGMTRRLLELDSHSTHGSEVVRRQRRQLAGAIDRHCAAIEPLKQRLAGLVTLYRQRQDAKVQAEIQAERELALARAKQEQEQKEQEEQEQKEQEEQQEEEEAGEASSPAESLAESSESSQPEVEDRMEEDEEDEEELAEVDRMLVEEPEESELEALRRQVREQAAEIAHLRSLLRR